MCNHPKCYMYLLQHHVEVDTSDHLVMMVTTMVMIMSWVHGQW